MSTNPSSQNTNSTAPTILQAVIWGAVAAAFGSLFAFIGQLLSDKPEPAPVIDPLHGATNPAQMNHIVDTLLTAGRTAIDHDSLLVTKIGFAIVALCVLVLICTVWVLARRRQLQDRPAPKWRSVVLILILALPPIIITIGTSFMEDRFLQAPSISEALRNENTRPPVVRRGTTVTVVVPLTLQSFFGYHLCRSIKLDRVVASLANGEEVPVTLTDVRCDDGGRKPGKTDVIPLMENVRLRLLFTLPDDPTLRGAVIGMVLSGDLWLIPQGSKEPTSTRHFDAEMHFRVARDEEADFQESYDTLSATLYRYNWLSFLTAGLVILAIIFLSPWVCIFCGGPVLGVKFKNVSVCRKCYDEREIE